MKRKLILATAMAALLASCSSNDLSVQTAGQSEESQEHAVSFEAYSQRNVTRAGHEGALTSAVLRDECFGVFAYYTDRNGYDQSMTPNFMYNQKVSYDADRWAYSPIKYWPNEYGSQAESDDIDKVTFFAYAPYTDSTPSTGQVEDDRTGITGFSGTAVAGDPMVRYVASLVPGQGVDLCWGVCDEADKSWQVLQGGFQTLEGGFPWMNVQHPKDYQNQKMKFTFKHALSQLIVRIDADVNTDNHGIGNEVDGQTKVFVRSITFNGFAMKGVLNLNNVVAGVPFWTGYNGNGQPLKGEPYTIHDGMKDGKEGAGKPAAYERVTGLNETIIQTKKWSELAAGDGVQKTRKNLFDSDDADAPVYVIPTGEDMSVTIVYDVETKVDSHPGMLSDNVTHGVSVENRFTKTISVAGSGGEALALEPGRKYTINLHLGLRSVDFDAEVGAWENGGAGEPTVSGDDEVLIVSGPAGFSVGTPFGIAPNGSAQFTATTIPATTVTWSSSDPVNFPVDQTGLVTASADAVGNSATITVTTPEGQTVTFTVFGSIPATGISLNQTSLDMAIDDADETLVATVEPDNATDKSVTWTTSDAAVATVDANGTVHPVGDGTATITATNSAGQTATCEVTVVSDITAMKPDALSSNALWKVAQYNVAQNKTSFVSSHSTASQYVFKWADAQTIAISGYHLPTWAEQVKIIPSTNASGNGTNWFSAVQTSPTAMNSASGNGWFTANPANNVYAVRIVDGVLTAWHYQWVTSPCNGLKIDSYVLKYQHKGAGTTWTDDEMKAILALLPSSSVWTTAAVNESPVSSSSTSSRCTRFLPACGRTNQSVGSGVATQYVGAYGRYWSATANGAYTFNWNFESGCLYECQLAQGYGFPVRLFHD